MRPLPAPQGVSQVSGGVNRPDEQPSRYVHHHPRLTPGQRREIRDRVNRGNQSLVALAQEYGVSLAAIEHAVGLRG